MYSDTSYNESELGETSETNEDSLSSKDLSSSLSESLENPSIEDSDYDCPQRGTGLDTDHNQPHYVGFQLSTWDSHLLIVKYGLHHSLTKQAVGNLLNLVGSHLPTKTIISAYKLKKYLFEVTSFTKHYCCSVCHCPFDEAGDECQNGCGSGTAEFLTASVEVQLRKLQGNIQ